MAGMRLHPVLLFLEPGQIALMIPLMAVMLVFGIPIIGILTSHFRKMAELKLRLKQEMDQKVLGEIRNLQQQITELRDTTTRYDMSFDTALQRIEQRVGHVERRVNTIEQGSSTSVHIGPTGLT